MIFNLHAQWWGAILAIFLHHHIFLSLLGFLMYPIGVVLGSHPKQDKLIVHWKKLDLNCKKNTQPQDYKVCENVMKFPWPSPPLPPPNFKNLTNFSFGNKEFLTKTFSFFLGLNFTSFNISQTLQRLQNLFFHRLVGIYNANQSPNHFKECLGPMKL